MDIFINDMWPTSVRLFPTAEAAQGIEAFSDGGASQAKINVYNLDVSSSGINDIFSDNPDLNPYVDVYTVTGIKVRSMADRQYATANLPAGLYIVDGKK